MKKIFISAAIPSVLIFTTSIYSQTMSSDPNALPKMISGRQMDSSPGSITVSGRVLLETTDPSQPIPQLYVFVYSNGRFIDKRMVSDKGFYSIDSVPRDNATVIVEADGLEVARQEILNSPSNIVNQDFKITLSQYLAAKKSAKVISAKNFYQRNERDQKQFERALSAIKEKDSNNAIFLFKELVKSDPKDFVSWNHLANLYLLNEKYKESEESFNKAIELKADYALAMIGLGSLYIDRKNLEKAITVLSKAVELSPESADAQHFLGEAYLQSKKGSKAVGYLNEALRLAPIEKAEIHLRLAALYNGANLKDRAAREYKTFLEKVPNYPDKKKLNEYIEQNLPK